MSREEDSAPFLPAEIIDQESHEDVSVTQGQLEPPEALASVSTSIFSRSSSLSEISEKSASVRDRFRVLYASWMVDWWLLEILALAAGALSLGAIILLLIAYQEKEPPTWPGGLTLNTVLAILAQAGSMTLTTALVGALSQQKWRHFGKIPKPLEDFDNYDEASRGPWGALFFLFAKSTRRKFCALGAISIVLLQAFQPLIQQVVSYPTKWEATQNATVSVSRSMAYYALDALSQQNLNKTYPSNQMKSGIYNGLYNSAASLSDNQPVCSSGNCTWPIYSTLGVCAYVADVSRFLQEHTYSSSSSGETTFYTLSTGGVLARGSENMSLHTIDPSTTDGLTSLVFRNTTSLSNFYTFFTSKKTNESILLETSLRLCTQTLNTSVFNGKTQTIELSRSTTIIDTDAWHVSIPGDNDTYIMGEYSFKVISDFLGQIFTGSYSIFPNGTINYDSDAIEVLVNTLLAEPYDQEAMAGFLNGFSVSMTNSLRSSGTDDSYNRTVTGTAYVPVTYVSVAWPYLTLPALLVLSTFIFLVATILQNERSGFGVWKASSLVTLRAMAGTGNSGMKTVSEAGRSAAEERVRLGRIGDGWVLE